MGLSIHYSGTLKSAALIQSLEEEVADVCRSLDWPCHFTATETLRGISFTPPGCETLSLTFRPDGGLVSGVLLMYDIHPATTISVKTQYAGIDVHITVLKLLRHLAARYFGSFHLHDEGGYWESGDEAALRRQFHHYAALLHAVSGALKGFTAVEGETPQSLADRLEAVLRRLSGKVS